MTVYDQLLHLAAECSLKLEALGAHPCATDPVVRLLISWYGG